MANLIASLSPRFEAGLPSIGTKIFLYTTFTSYSIAYERSDWVRHFALATLAAISWYAPSTFRAVVVLRIGGSRVRRHRSPGWRDQSSGLIPYPITPERLGFVKLLVGPGKKRIERFANRVIGDPAAQSDRNSPGLT